MEKMLARSGRGLGFIRGVGHLAGRGPLGAEQNRKLS